MPSNRSLQRDWSKDELKSISEKLSLRSGSVSASARFINSVSDLYATDEIDALLDEIRDLEPLSLHTDDLQDFEIDGSVTRLHRPLDMTACESRNSIRSWDSHALYRGNDMDDNEGRNVGGPVSVYCDTNHLKTPIGILRIVLLISSMISLGCLLYSGTALYGLFMLPYMARIRLMIFVNLLALMMTLLFLVLDITLLYVAFPFHYHRMAIALYTIEFAAFMSSSALILQLTFIYRDSFPWISRVTRDQMIASAAFGFIAGLVALGLAGFGMWEMCRLHFPKREDTDQLTLTERAAQNATTANTLINMNATCQSSSGPGGGGGGGGPPNTMSASAVPIAAPRSSTKSKSASNKQSAPPMTSSSLTAEPQVTTTVWPIMDDMPCSSKHIPGPSCNNNTQGGASQSSSRHSHR